MIEIKPFDRVEINESVYIAVRTEDTPMHSFCPTEFLGIKENGGWIDIDTDADYDDEWRVARVWRAPSSISNLMNHHIFGELAYDEDKSRLAPELEKRIAYFQTHIDALKENVESLQASLEKIKQGEV